MTPTLVNEHFRPLHLLCEFGKIPYDYIGELDNSPEMDFLSLHIGANTTFNSLTAPQQHRGATTRFPCSALTVDRVAKFYAHDAHFLGYNFEEASRVCSTHGFTSPPDSPMTSSNPTSLTLSPEEALEDAGKLDDSRTIVNSDTNESDAEGGSNDDDDDIREVQP
jgi:hypothetical protein